MSQNSTPGHSSPQSYDSQYDYFTAEITSKMRVPDKICVIEGPDKPDLISHQPAEIKSRMNVPERILVAGDNKHIAVRESLPELKFETPFPANLPNLILAPPPNVLTVDEYPYPSVDEKPVKFEVTKKSIIDEEYNGRGDIHDTSMNASINSDDELAKLRAQMRLLSRRVLAIEQENQQRQQRELIMYTVGIAYIVLKGFLWLHRQF